MHTSVLASEARRKKVTLRIDAELAEKAKAAGIDTSRIVEAALTRALLELDREKLREAIAQDSRALEAYVDKHGDPVAELGEMFGGFDAT
jgi:post-segregation antitoxin (ccd killing protein)